MSMTIRDVVFPRDLRLPAAADRPREVSDAAEMIRIVRARWRFFRNVCLAVIAASLVVVIALPSTYSTSAVVMLEPRKNNVTDQTSVLSETPTDPASIQNQIQLLTSRDLAARVVEKLQLDRDPELSGAARRFPFNLFGWLRGETTDQDMRDAAVSAFLKHLTVEAVGLSTTITVTFSSHDPHKAALIANTVVDSYLDMQAAIKYDVAQRTTAWLLDRIRQLGQQAQAAEANVQRYKVENNLTDTSNGESLVDQQLAAINAQLVGARENLAAKEAENARIVSLLQSGRAADVSQIVSSPLIIQLREQQADVIRTEALLAARYGPRHPKMIAAESQKRDLAAKIGEEVARIAGSVQNEAAVARAQVHSLEESLQRVEGEAAGQNMARVKLQSLEANAASTRSMYESFVSRLRETQGQDALRILDARMISHAPVPNAPSWPPRFAIVAASIPAGFLLGLLVVLLAERFDGVMRFETREEDPPQRDPLKETPVLAEVSGSPANLVADQPNSAAAQAMRLLARRVATPVHGLRPIIVLVTSLYQHEGQTGIALALARAAAQSGSRVVLFDGNLRMPAAALQAGLQAAPAAIAEVLNGNARLSRSVQRDPRSSALILSGPAHNSNPHEVWASLAMEKLTAYFRQVCDLVIVDGVPIVPGSELPLIAGHCDAMIVVAAANDAPRPELRAALDYVRSTANLPVGLVFTR